MYSIPLIIFSTGILSLIIKHRYKASLLITVLVFVFFSYGHLSNSLNDSLFIELPNKIVLGPDKVLLPALLLALMLVFLKVITSQKSYRRAIGFLNVSLLVITVFLGVTVAQKESLKRIGQENVTIQADSESIDHPAPDIYYIILDGYARQDVLAEIYHYDNSKFIDELEKMGFYVANQARSNYLHTYLSLPSSLNMRYLDDLPEKYGQDPTNGLVARQLAADSEVVKKLREKGYTIINFASTWDGTNENFNADITYNSDQYFRILGKNLILDETNITFLQTTLFSPLINRVWGDALRARVLTTLQKLPTVSFLKEKKFVMAHIIAPHPPYVFTAEGNPVPGEEFEFADEGVERRPKYLGQLTFISNQIVPVIQRIIKNSDTPPIIVLQADHGPASIFGKREDWLKNYSTEGVWERSSILYAVYFPNRDYRQFYDTITPVNTFRIVFNTYFGANYDPLPDRTYYTSYENIYGFKDVTDVK